MAEREVEAERRRAGRIIAAATRRISSPDCESGRSLHADAPETHGARHLSSATPRPGITTVCRYHAFSAPFAASATATGPTTPVKPARQHAVANVAERSRRTIPTSRKPTVSAARTYTPTVCRARKARPALHPASTGQRARPERTP